MHVSKCHPEIREQEHYKGCCQKRLSWAHLGRNFICKTHIYPCTWWGMSHSCSEKEDADAAPGLVLPRSLEKTYSRKDLDLGILKKRSGFPCHRHPSVSQWNQQYFPVSQKWQETKKVLMLRTVSIPTGRSIYHSPVTWYVSLEYSFVSSLGNTPPFLGVSVYSCFTFLHSL